MKLLTRPRAHVALQDRLVWQAASLLLAYPDNGHADRLHTVEELRTTSPDRPTNRWPVRTPPWAGSTSARRPRTTSPPSTWPSAPPCT